MSEKFTLYDDSKYENHAINELPLTSKNISKKEEQSKAFIKPIILDRNKYLNYNNWELGLDYTDFTGNDVQNAFELGWDACIEDLYKNKGFPVDLNGNVISYEQAMENVELFNEHMKDEFLNKACEWLRHYQEYPNKDISAEALIVGFRKYMEG